VTPRSPGDLESLAGLGNWGWRGIGSIPAAIAGNCVGGRKSWAISHSVLPHQLEDFRRAFSAVLDGIDTCQNGSAHAFCSVRVSGNNTACTVCCLDGSSHFSLTECWATRLAGAPVIVRIQLDDVRASAYLMTHGYDHG